ncbi:MAG: tyrosine-type recombinase/integrase, partial [Mycobacterium sp.]
MTTLRERLEEYLVMRRALGFQLNDIQRQVGLFCTWLKARGQTKTFTIDDAVTWARLNPDAHPSWWATRLSLVRRFAAYLNANGVDVPVIPRGLLPAKKPRAVPYIYSQNDVDALLAACAAAFTDDRITATVRTVIGLLTATGLRISEALNLRVDDINFDDDVLVIKAAKSAERLVPVHPSTTAA